MMQVKIALQRLILKKPSQGNLSKIIICKLKNLMLLMKIKLLKWRKKITKFIINQTMKVIQKMKCFKLLITSFLLLRPQKKDFMIYLIYKIKKISLLMKN